MTGTPVVESPRRNAISRPLLCVIVFAATVAVGAILRWAAERPARPEFWPVVIAIGVALAIFTWFRPIPYLSYNESPPESAATALTWALVWGLVEGAIFWALYYLAWSDGRYWGIALMFGALGATNRYFHGRHLPKRHRAQILMVVIVLLIIIAAKYATKH